MNHQVQESEIMFIRAELHGGRPYRIIIATNAFKDLFGYLLYTFKEGKCYIKELYGCSKMITTLLEVKLMEKVPGEIILHEL
jgi:hypothetical protein